MKRFTKGGLRPGLWRLCCLALLVGACALPWPALAASPDLVISQVYGGGGNSGATYKNDFIELFNRSGAPVSLNGWSVQYASATGSSWQVTNLGNVTLQPGQYYLVQEAAGTGGSVALPTPDATGSINMSGTAGKVALVSGTAALSCGAAGNSCIGNAAVRDFVGFGSTATNFEGTAPTTAPSNTTAVIRSLGGCVDSDNNVADFSAAAPAPRTSASPTSACVAPVAGACGGDNGQTLAAYAPANLCQSGAPSAVSGAGHPWTWSCNGAGGGSSASCSASVQSYLVSYLTDGHGTLQGATSQSVDFGALTSAVNAVADGGYSFLNWTGDGSFGATTANPLSIGPVTSNRTVTANFSAQPVSGACGADDGKTLAASAPANLCLSGLASSVGGSGHPWTWSCSGANGGVSASCSAAIQSYTLSFATDGNGTIGGAASQTQTVDFGALAAPVFASAKDGYFFRSWTGSGGFASTGSNPLAIGPVSSSQSFTANFKGGFTIFHVNDTHARVTPHKWMVTEHGTGAPLFEDVGGAAFLAGEMLQLTASQPNSLVIDAGDISEGNPIGDLGGNGTMTQFYSLLSAKLAKQRGRGIDAVVVGNHDVRDANYIGNMVALQNSGVPVVSVNVRDAATHTPYFAPYQIVTINGTKIGILGYTTSAAEVGASLANEIEVADCDWSSSDPTKVHLSDYVNELRTAQGCDVVVLAAHIGHSSLVDPAAPLLVDNGAAKLPEVVVTGHWHTWSDTVWQPEMLNYKTIFTESASYMKYIGELKVTDTGAYLSSAQHVIRDADITPDPDVQRLIDNLSAQYDQTHPGHPVREVIGYTADNLMLDNNMKWWSSNEYPWSGNNTAGQWICDAMRWKAEQLFGQCDLSIEAGGGVRADIPAGPVTYLQIYETFPWNDDTFYRVNMTGQEIVNFLKSTNVNAGFSRELEVTAFDGVPTNVRFNGQPIDLARSYSVAINNYMYAHPPTGVTWSDTAPLSSDVLCRDGIVDFMRQFTSDNPYRVGGDRYHLNTEFSGGYRAVVTMMNDADSKTNFEDAFIRFLSATPETLARRGSNQVPADLVNADGTINAGNRLSEAELYRSYLGFKNGVIKPGDIIETWGKGSFYGGNPEFVDQEGIYADGVEFKVVGHDDSLAKPAFVSSIGAFWDDAHKNRYVQFLAKKTGTGTVTDQYGRSLSLMDATGYTAKSLPGATGDTLLVSGVPTMESFGLRFRCDNAVTSGLPLPSPSTVSSRLDQVAPGTNSGQLTLSASASVSGGSYLLAPVADAQVASLRPTSNFGTGNNLYLQSSSAGYGNERAWLKFDLSAIPAGTVISSATLKLYDWKSTGAALPAEVRAGNDDSWSESGITWNSQPPLGDTALDTQTLAAGVAGAWYGWDVTPLTQAKLGGNKLVSLVLKPVAEDSSDATAPSYGFDAREYGSNAPFLEIGTQAPTATVARVQFYYRFSTDNAVWGPWTLAGTAGATPYTANFSFPRGTGYYEFYSQATDSSGTTEPAPAAAQAATHYSSTPAYYPIVSLDGLYQRYDGTGKPVTVSTIPAGTPVSVTYDGSQGAPTQAGTYTVAVTPQGSSVSTSATLFVVKGSAAVSLTGLAGFYDELPKTVGASTVPAGLATAITYDGSSTPPTAAGSYAVAAQIVDPNYQGGATGTLTIAPEVTSRVSLATSAFVYSRATKTYGGTLTVTNTGRTPLSGTLTLQLNNLPASITALNATGTNNGAPQFSKALAVPLASGQSLSLPLQFTNPGNLKISFNPVLYLN